MTTLSREELRAIQSGEARAPKAKREDLETPVHRAILNYLRSVLPPSHEVFHPANGGSRNKIEAAKLKSMGVVAGVADLVILRTAGRVAFIEVKPAGGRQSAAQRAFQSRCKQRGTPYAVCQSINDAREFLEREGIATKESKNV